MLQALAWAARPRAGVPGLSHGYCGSDGRMWRVAFEADVFESEIEDRVDIGIELQSWQRSRLPGQLQASLFHMVVLDVSVAQRMDEITHA